MRARRRSSRGRREPLFWSRACAQANGQFEGPTDIDACDDSEVKFGIVLFDSLAARMNDTEARTSIRSLRWPCDVQTQSGGSNTPSGTLWCVVGVSAVDPTVFVSSSTTLGLLLGVGGQRPLDILDVRLWSIGGGLSAAVTNSWEDGSDIGRPFEIKTQRKLGPSDTIVALFGFMGQFGQMPGAAQTWFASVNCVISALWSRTLR